ncbi:MAG: hypothetical protein IT452_13570 [Planctomycetia bacterium]|nr:hypothetical protein [Planctomycetia bacterium]
MLVTARYGEMRYVADFTCDVANVRRGTRAVLATERGVELGEILVVNKERPAAPRQRGEGERRSEYDKPGISGNVVRVATPDDISAAQKLHLNEEVAEYDFCAAKIAELKLDMQLVCSEHLLGGEKIIFYFLSENRVDFRDLVKELTGQFKARIELRQIGARDSARLVGDFNSCGRQLCCQTFIKDFEPITMKMAKNQRTTLDPEKISGRCGKLKCCLKYENDVYLELKKLLPNIGAKVKTKKGNGEVADQNVISQEFQLQLETGEWVKCWGSDVIEILTPGNADAPPKRRPRLPPPGADEGRGRGPRPGGAPAAGAPAAGAPAAGPAGPPRADRWPRKDKPVSQGIGGPGPAVGIPPMEPATPPAVEGAAPGGGAGAPPAAPGTEEIEKSPSTQRQSRGAGSPSVLSPGSVDMDDITAELAKAPSAPPPPPAPPPPAAGGPPADRRPFPPRDRRDRDRGGRDRRPQPGAPQPPQGGAPPGGPAPLTPEERKARRERREREWRERVEKRILERQARAAQGGAAPDGGAAMPGAAPQPPVVPPAGSPPPAPPQGGPSQERPPEHRGGVRGHRHRHRGGRGRGPGGPRPGPSGGPPPQSPPPAPPPPPNP